jgi:hypothetical protein
MKEAFNQINWTEVMNKVWHLALVLGSAYAATNPKLNWALPALTSVAGFSAPPGVPKLKSISIIAVAVGAGFVIRAI